METLTDHAADASHTLSSRQTGMAFQRTRMSADRTLMSAIRTSLVLIAAGLVRGETPFPVSYTLIIALLLLAVGVTAILTLALH